MTRQTSRLLRRPYSPTVFSSASLPSSQLINHSQRLKRRNKPRSVAVRSNVQTRGLERATGDLVGLGVTPGGHGCVSESEGERRWSSSLS